MPAHRTLRIVDGLILAPPCHAVDAGDIRPARDQFKQCLFTRPAHDRVNVARIDGRIRIQRGKVAAPGDRHIRADRADGAADFYRGRHLRPRHDRDRGERRWRVAKECLQIGVDIADVPVENRIAIPSFEGRRERQQRQRQAHVPWRAHPRIDQQHERRRSHERTPRSSRYTVMISLPKFRDRSIVTFQFAGTLPRS